MPAMPINHDKSEGYFTASSSPRHGAAHIALQYESLIRQATSGGHADA
jgi:hypothetical protein